jgi:hypothetical protein
MSDETKLIGSLTVAEFRSLFFPDRSSSFRSPELIVAPPPPAIPKQGKDYVTVGDMISHTEEEWEGILGYKVPKPQMLTWWVNEPDKKLVILKG